MVEPSAVVVAEKTSDGPRKGEKKGDKYEGERVCGALRRVGGGFFPGLHLPLPLTRWMDSGTAQRSGTQRLHSFYY
jgi:hypothetical protein